MKTAEERKRYNAEYYRLNRERLLASANASAKRRYAEDKQRKLTKNRAWWLANQERHRALVRENYHANIERERARNRQKHADKPDQTRVRVSRRRAVLNGAPGTHTEADIRALYAFQKSMCAVCRCRLGKDYHVDHIVPLSSGGSNYKTNLQLLCEPCNLSKGKQHPVSFMQRRGYLL